MTTLAHDSLVSETDQMRFWIWVEKTSNCWEWRGGRFNNGYGRTKIGGMGRIGAHRLSWIIAHNADIPNDLVIDHTCHNPICVNPDHLNAVTNKQNLENYKPVRAKSGYRGVHRHGKKFRATVVHHGEKVRSKPFDTAAEANEAAIRMRNQLFTNNLLDPSIQ